MVCSPLKGITIYKGYLDRRRRIILFAHNNGLIYPVYVADKHDLLARNITVDKVRTYAEKWHGEVLEDITRKRYKIRHY
jgi:hypothetical protein